MENKFNQIQLYDTFIKKLTFKLNTKENTQLSE